MWTLRGFLCNWKRTGNELMASVVLLLKSRENSFGRDPLEVMPMLCWTGNPVDMTVFSLVRGRKLSSRRSHSPRPHHQPHCSMLLCASCLVLCSFSFIHSGKRVREFTWQGQGSSALQCRGRNPIEWYPCQNSPSGSAILSSRALGRGRAARVRVKMKDSVPCSSTQPRAHCKTAESSNPLCGSSSTGHELDLVTFLRKLGCS